MLIVFIINIPKQYSKVQSLKEMIENKSYSIVEGVTVDFLPPVEGLRYNESFAVNGIKFEYSDYGIIEGFHKTSKNNGPIHQNGQQVRIGYTTIDNENLILRLEIAK
ncbi:hypothetical protein ALGA_3365 [Labilibaculum antarcticum]|uniref:Uncharacterized protein n=2 Tax=Labilibaculum antarcticum TaxID=1717717 RepID=A0A1Y1CNS4_9BACT|nr:hypothetical protein ALGA_3365 [Labilibaculum antarcticum]